MTSYLLFVLVIYYLLIVALRIGWERSIGTKKIIQTNHNFFISVVVAIRDEESNIERLLDNLHEQKYPSSDFEVIIVDDHSNDNSGKLVTRLIDNLTNFKIISLNENEIGKKAALAKGIALAKGEIIATTDADCTLPCGWLENINAEFYRDKVNMAVGLVSISGKDDFFSRWQSLEFASVMGTAIATIGLGLPTMCNGANLSFRKKVFEEVNGYSGNEHIASGDDEFLMRKILKKYPDSVYVLNDQSAVVATTPVFSVSDFIHQRLRWASKWRSNTSFVSRFLAIFVFSLQGSWIALFASLFLSDSSSRILLIILLLKVTVELLFLLPVIRFLSNKFQLFPFIGLQFLYPFYVVFIGIFSQWRAYRWKGRSIT
jgi:poly-beta-1,6-N-acetyl-D-glucosamine synthase